MADTRVASTYLAVFDDKQPLIDTQPVLEAGRCFKTRDDAPIRFIQYAFGTPHATANLPRLDRSSDAKTILQLFNADHTDTLAKLELGSQNIKGIVISSVKQDGQPLRTKLFSIGQEDALPANLVKVLNEKPPHVICPNGCGNMAHGPAIAAVIDAEDWRNAMQLYSTQQGIAKEVMLIKDTHAQALRPLSTTHSGLAFRVRSHQRPTQKVVASSEVGGEDGTGSATRDEIDVTELLAQLELYKSQNKEKDAVIAAQKEEIEAFKSRECNCAQDWESFLVDPAYDDLCSNVMGGREREAKYEALNQVNSKLVARNDELEMDVAILRQDNIDLSRKVQSQSVCQHDECVESSTKAELVFKCGWFEEQLHTLRNAVEWRFS